MRTLTKRETWALQQGWRRVFAKGLHRMTGRWSHGRSDRETLQHKYVRRLLTGATAEEEYAKAQGAPVYVVADDGRAAEVYDKKPELPPGDAGVGVLIFPENFAWTLGTGSEYWDRVCFMYREWVDDDESASP
jgi:hypothetical protein